MRAALVFLSLLVACSGAEAPPTSSRSSSSRRHTPEPTPEPTHDVELPDVRPLPPSTYPAPARLVAIGDVHGDIDAFRDALRLAGAIDETSHWVGGELFVVQTGDLLDRGDDEEDILALVLRLEDEARMAGGHFVALNGNHELMNVQGDFRYVTPGGFEDFEHFAPGRRGRSVAFAPNGRYARELAGRNTVVVVGDTVLLHAGLTPRWAASIDTVNRDARAFFLGEAPLGESLSSEDGPVWYRGFATADDPETCARLAEALTTLHASRMVIGHTVQEGGITSACDGRVQRIDVGLARLYGGPIEVLEITEGGVRVLHGERSAPR